MSCEVLLPSGECGEDLGFAIVGELVANIADAELRWCGDGGDVVEGAGERGAVAEIAKEQAEGIEGWCKVAAPDQRSSPG